MVIELDVTLFKNGTHPLAQAEYVVDVHTGAAENVPFAKVTAQLPDDAFPIVAKPFDVVPLWEIICELASHSRMPVISRIAPVLFEVTDPTPSSEPDGLVSAPMQRILVKISKISAFILFPF